MPPRSRVVRLKFQDEEMAYKQLHYIKYQLGEHIPHVLIDAVHAASPAGDAFTGDIAAQVSEVVGCHCIIATVSRKIADLNRSPSPRSRNAVQEYRQTIHTILEASNLLTPPGTLRQPFLHMAIHGMEDRDDKDIELGTVHGRSCTPLVRDWVYAECKRWACSSLVLPRQPIIVIDEELSGDPSIAHHAHGEPKTGYPGYGDKFNTIQIEIAHWLRVDYQPEIVELLATLAGDFGKETQRQDMPLVDRVIRGERLKKGDDAGKSTDL